MEKQNEISNESGKSKTKYQTKVEKKNEISNESGKSKLNIKRK